MSWPPIPQALDYHTMADERALLGIPNSLNVLSNAPFAIVGLLGLAAAFGWMGRPSPFTDRWERWPYAALFAGVALTAAGSSYYHLAPDNARLVWDRLPMAVGFMGLLTALLAERVSLTAGKWLFLPLLAAGAASVGYLVLERAAEHRRFAPVSSRAVRVSARCRSVAGALPGTVSRHGESGRRSSGLRGGKGTGDRRSADFRARARGQRPYPQTPRGGRRRRLSRRHAARARARAGTHTIGTT